MNCAFRQVEDGNRRLMKCERCLRTLLVPRSSGDNIQVPCKGWPRWWEAAEVADFSLAVLGLRPNLYWARKLGLIKPDVSALGIGPGTELALILSSLGESKIGLACGSRANQMNDWGPTCIEHRQEIVDWLAEGTRSYRMSDKLRVALLAARSGVLFRMYWRDPLGSIVDEAIRRSSSPKPQ